MANCALLRAGVAACVPEEHGSRVAAVRQVDTVGVVVDGGGGGGGGGVLGAEEVSGVVGPGPRHAASSQGLTLEHGDIQIKRPLEIILGS